MNNFFLESAFAGVSISLIAYMAGGFLKKKFKIGLFNPLLISIIVTMVVLIVGKVDYESYNAGAKYLSWLLTPATVCLAIPLYEQIQLLKSNFAAIVSGIAAGVVTSLLTVLVLSAFYCQVHSMTGPSLLLSLVLTITYILRNHNSAPEIEPCSIVFPVKKM